MNTSGLLQNKSFTILSLITLQETRSIPDSMNTPKIKSVAYISILLLRSKIKKNIYNLG